MRTLGLAAGFVLAAFGVSDPVHAQDEPPQDRGTVESVRSLLVEVPVTVSVRGEPVLGLTAEDFVVFDGKKRQKIVGFDVLDLQMTAGAETPNLDPQVSIAARRRFLVLFDLSFSDARTIHRAREVVADWVATALHPWDLVGVAVYSARSGSRMILNFTSDRDQVLLAVNTLGIPEFLERGGDPLALELGGVDANRYSGDDPTAANTPMNKYNTNIGEQQVMDAMRFIYRGAYEPINRQGARQYVTEMTRSLGGLVHIMRHLGGRKHVVLLSEGFEDDLIFAVDRNREVMELNQIRESGEIWNVDSSKRFGSTVAQARLTDMVEAFRRADCSIQAIDISTLDAIGESQALSTGGAQSLFYLANETGGEMYRNFADLDSAMATLMKKTSVTYLLTFSPSRLEDDGSYHKIRVKLKKKLPGAQVYHRPGYYAPTPQGRLGPDELRMQAASQVMQGTEGGSLGASVLATPFRDGDALSYVPVLVEIDGLSLPGLDGREPVSVEIYAYAIAADGSIADYFTQQLNIDPRVIGDEVRRKGLKYYGDMQLAPGTYSLRVLIREQDRGVYGSRVVSLTVPEFDDAGIDLLPPMFPDAPGAWLMAREIPEGPGGKAERPFPYMAGDQPFIPAASPVVDSRGPSRVYLVAYDSGQGPVSVEASLISSSGDVVDGPRIDVWEEHDGAPDGKIVYLATLEPGGLKAGRYVLSVKMVDEASGREDSSSIPLLVLNRPGATETAKSPGPATDQTDGSGWGGAGFPAPRR